MMVDEFHHYFPVTCEKIGLMLRKTEIVFQWCKSRALKDLTIAIKLSKGPFHSQGRSMILGIRKMKSNDCSGARHRNSSIFRILSRDVRLIGDDGQWSVGSPILRRF
jgi:hypothetical protein